MQRRHVVLRAADRRDTSPDLILMSLGIDGARVQTKSYGEEKPKDPAQTEEAYRVNRRVEFVILQG